MICDIDGIPALSEARWPVVEVVHDVTGVYCNQGIASDECIGGPVINLGGPIVERRTEQSSFECQDIVAQPEDETTPE